ncbi:hypothetical protein FLA105534_02934 [Flavobacterium bizetiae]|uniref:DUF5071 domain-containing protein n=2 Tax=Flavobacterium bizetiae TaxID=2704140 RepID=A0A6J4GP71_9FLAO|nr:hypothetical protein FLA105534_02934 [Flavobacterium bizetiae]CAD5343485.1 hypothetical protein FLA105535_03483 [Flavobacterium bizetiae]CAD5349478.1 hypothetical protein FLA105534_03462 [Flavobacterium bizetiae]
MKMDIKTLIPKDKFDFETVEKLTKYSFKDIEPIVPDLLEWLQDINWPISQPIAEFLIPFSEEIAPEILKILKGKDEIWKYWILTTFGKNIKNELVLQEINRIAKNPTQDEIDEGVDEIANEINDN